MRTFNAADWTASLQAWDEGRFSDEWKPFRHQAVMRGILYPPSGTRHDSWDDAEPSQRAVLIRAIRETPDLLRSAIEHSKSWHDVIAYVMARRDEWRIELEARERVEEREREREQNPAEAVLSLRAILDRIGQS